jgi:hypothetical protein
MSDTPKRKISGPGAGDFVGAQGGIDFPDNATSKGTGQLRDEDTIASPDRVTPDLEVDDQSSEDKPTL